MRRTTAYNCPPSPQVRYAVFAPARPFPARDRRHYPHRRTSARTPIVPVSAAAHHAPAGKRIQRFQLAVATGRDARRLGTGAAADQLVADAALRQQIAVYRDPSAHRARVRHPAAHGRTHQLTRTRADRWRRERTRRWTDVAWRTYRVWQPVRRELAEPPAAHVPRALARAAGYVRRQGIQGVAFDTCWKRLQGAVRAGDQGLGFGVGRGYG